MAPSDHATYRESTLPARRAAPGVGPGHRRVRPRLVDESQPPGLDLPHPPAERPPLPLDVGPVAIVRVHRLHQIPVVARSWPRVEWGGSEGKSCRSMLMRYGIITSEEDRCDHRTWAGRGGGWLRGESVLARRRRSGSPLAPDAGGESRVPAGRQRPVRERPAGIPSSRPGADRQDGDGPGAGRDDPVLLRLPGPGRASLRRRDRRPVRDPGGWQRMFRP